jgi:hypothetical protein
VLLLTTGIAALGRHVVCIQIEMGAFALEAIQRENQLGAIVMLQRKTAPVVLKKPHVRKTETDIGA